LTAQVKTNLIITSAAAGIADPQNGAGVTYGIRSTLNYTVVGGTGALNLNNDAANSGGAGGDVGIWGDALNYTGGSGLSYVPASNETFKVTLTGVEPTGTDFRLRADDGVGFGVQNQNSTRLDWASGIGTSEGIRVTVDMTGIPSTHRLVVTELEFGNANAISGVLPQPKIALGGFAFGASGTLDAIPTGSDNNVISLGSGVEIIGGATGSFYITQATQPLSGTVGFSLQAITFDIVPLEVPAGVVADLVITAAEAGIADPQTGATTYGTKSNLNYNIKAGNGNLGLNNEAGNNGNANINIWGDALDFAAPVPRVSFAPGSDVPFKITLVGVNPTGGDQRLRADDGKGFGVGGGNATRVDWTSTAGSSEGIRVELDATNIPATHRLVVTGLEFGNANAIGTVQPQPQISTLAGAATGFEGLLGKIPPAATNKVGFNLGAGVEVVGGGTGSFVVSQGVQPASGNVGFSLQGIAVEVLPVGVTANLVIDGSALGLTEPAVGLGTSSILNFTIDGSGLLNLNHAFANSGGAGVADWGDALDFTGEPGLSSGSSATFQVRIYAVDPAGTDVAIKSNEDTGLSVSGGNSGKLEWQSANPGSESFRVEIDVTNLPSTEKLVIANMQFGNGNAIGAVQPEANIASLVNMTGFTGNLGAIAPAGPDPQFFVVPGGIEIVGGGGSAKTGSFVMSQAAQPLSGSVGFSLQGITVDVVPAPAEPAISIMEVGGQLEITYSGGVIQESTSLSGWTTLDPQPASPFTVILAPGEKIFYQVIP
jgi:hypothetical protein